VIVRVAITGSHGVGKTTLVDTLYDREDICASGVFSMTIAEASRVVAKRLGYSTLADILYWPEDKRIHFQWLIMAEQMSRETSLVSFISDRCIIDNLAYCIYYNCPQNMIDAMWGLCKLHINSYDMVLYTPIPKQIRAIDAKDGFRLADLKSIMDVDNIINNIIDGLDQESLGKIYQLSTDRESWAKESAMEIIERSKE